MAAPVIGSPPADVPNKLSESEGSTTTPVNRLSEYANIYDDTYSAIKTNFLKQGRGRRPALPTVPLSNKLLVQLSALKDEVNASWDVVLSWFMKLFPGQALTAAQLQYKIQKTLWTMESLPRAQLMDFLIQDVQFIVVPVDLTEIGLTRDVLLGDAALYSPPSTFVPSYQTILSLHMFGNKEGLPENFVVRWIQTLIQPIPSTPSQIVNKLRGGKRKKLKLRNNAEGMALFLKEPLFGCNVVDNQPKNPELVSLKRDVLTGEKALKLCNNKVSVLSGKLDCVEGENRLLKVEVTDLSTENLKLKRDKYILQEEIDRLNALMNSRKPCRKSHDRGAQTNSSKVKNIENTLSQLSEQKKMLTDNSDTIKSLNDDIDVHMNNIDLLQNKIKKLNKEKRTEQQLKSKFKTQLNDTLTAGEIILSEENDCHCKNLKLKVE